MAERFAAVAARAQRLDGFAQTLESVSGSSRFKVEQSIVDDAVYATCDGSAWFKIFDSTGPAGGLVLPYTATIPIGTMSGTGLTINTAGQTPTGTLTGQRIDMSGLAASAFSVQGLEIIGNLNTAAKVTAPASSRVALLNLKGRSRNLSTLSTIVRNKQALAGSLWFLGWDDVNFEGSTANTTLSGSTHMLTLDAQTNVTPGANAVVGVNIMIPNTSRGDVSLEAGLVVNNLSRTFKTAHFSQALEVGQAIRVDYGTAATQSGACYMLVLDGITGFTPGSATYTGLFVGIPGTSRAETVNEGGVLIRSSATRQRVVEARIRNTGGTAFALSYDTNTTIGSAMTMMSLAPGLDPAVTVGLNAALVGLNIDCTSRINAGGQQIGALNVYVGGNGSDAANTSYCANFDYRVPVGTTSGNGIVNVGGSATLTGNLVGIECDLTGFTAGTLACVGARVLIPQSSSASSRGITITTNASGSGATGIELLVSPTTAASSVLGIDITASANTGDGSAMFRGITSGSGIGLFIRHSAATNPGSPANLNLIQDTGAVTGTRNGRLFLVSRSNSFAGTGAYAIDVMAVDQSPSVSSGTLTVDKSVLIVSNTPSRSGGTLNISSVVLDIAHAPTGTVNTDTSTGLRVTMTPSGAQNVVGASFTMAVNANGAALTIAHSGTNANQFVFTSAVDGTGSHIYGPTTAAFYIKAGTAAQAAATTAGRDVSVNASPAVAGASSAGAAAGGSIYLNAGAAARLTSGNANGGGVEINAGAGIGTGVAGGILMSPSTPTYAEWYEMTAPAAGAANTARVFAQDNGAGKTQLMVQFASGAAQQLAIQP